MLQIWAPPPQIKQQNLNSAANKRNEITAYRRKTDTAEPGQFIQPQLYFYPALVCGPQISPSQWNGQAHMSVPGPCGLFNGPSYIFPCPFSKAQGKLQSLQK